MGTGGIIFVEELDMKTAVLSGIDTSLNGISYSVNLARLEVK
jgi:hypothetical protein